MKQVYFITGGTSELGVTLLKQLLADSGDSDRFIVHGFSNSSVVQELQQQYSDVSIDFVRADLSSDDGIDQLLEFLSALETPPTHWIHIPAPKLKYSNFAKVPTADFDLNFQVQVRSAIRLAQLLVPKMGKQRYGRVVFVLSTCIYGGVKYMSSYQIAKFGLLGLMHALAAEFEEKSVCVNAVAPSMMDTQFLSEVPELVKELEREKSPTGELVSAQRVAQAIRVLLTEEGHSALVTRVDTSAV
jgi:3-oxoacyl-[acyl-carrier protein] reductase